GVRFARLRVRVVGGGGGEGVVILDRDGAAGVARFLDQLERTTHVHARLLDADGRDVAGRVVPPRAIAVAARALDTGQTETEADGQAAVKARAVAVSGGRRYVLVAAVPVGVSRLPRAGPV